ncbi:PAS domain S-box protein [Halobaculum limi]|uniref:PAS domain S-box protein n=1 Tax=Halobaculum limi TaxID=3031916 RepID=UPI0024062AC7|nr:PAS domain S-box protein [Halobaculum sp. YSMS11]
MTPGASDAIRILHVDDEPQIGDLTARFLEREDDRFEVETTTEVSEAVDRLASVECVISDYDMPEYTGIEFLRVVREEYPNLPFILFTGKGSEEVAAEAISAGVTDYLQKRGGSDQYTLLANRVSNAVERRRAERSAAETEQRLTELASNTEDILWGFSGDWEECLFLNAAYDDIWGQPRHAVKEDPMAFLDSIHPDDRQRARDAMTDLTAGTSVDLELRVNESANFDRWVWVQGQAITDTAGNVVRVVGFARDVTERKQHEQALHELHTTLADLQAAETPEAVCDRIVDAAEQILSFDLCLTALERDGELVIATASEQFGDNRRSQLSVSEGLAGETFRRGETIVADGTDDHEFGNPTGEYQSFLSAPIGEHGVFQAVSADESRFDAVDRDLTELLTGHAKQALDRLARDRELKQYERMVNAAGDMMYVLDSTGRIEFANDTATALTGYDRETLLGESIDLLIDSDDRAAGDEYIAAMLSDRRDPPSDAFSWTLVTADGERIDVESQITLLNDGDEWRGTVGVVRDITERRERERELERKNQRLEEFTQLASHDLRNPLNIATGHTELAAEECDSEHLETATRALDRMDGLIDDLLTLSKQGRSLGDVEAVALSEVADEAWAMVETDEATLDVTTDLVVRADASRLRELLGNLFHNSVEHGGDSVTITVGRLDPAAGFYVEDDGAGIAEDDYERVFESGYTTGDDGTGFGLDIVREIATAHGWTLDLTESEALGTRFEFRNVDVA